MDKWRYHPGVERLQRAQRESSGGCRAEHIPPGVGKPARPRRGVDLPPHDSRSDWRSSGDPRADLRRADVVAGNVVGLLGLLGDDPWSSGGLNRSAERRREVRLICEGGVAVLPDPYGDHVLVAARGADGPNAPDTELRAISTELPLLRELRAFLEHLDGGEPPRSSAVEAAGRGGDRALLPLRACRRDARRDGPRPDLRQGRRSGAPSRRPSSRRSPTSRCS